MFLPVPPAPDVPPRTELLSDVLESIDEPSIIIRRRWRLRHTVFLALILLVACGAGAAWYFIGEDRNEFFGGGFGTNGAFFGELVNQTQHEIEQRYGKPDNEWEGYRPLGTRIPEQLPEGRIKTLLLHGRGGLNNAEGTVMVWLVERRRGWVCFESTWFGGNVWFP